MLHAKVHSCGSDWFLETCGKGDMERGHGDLSDICSAVGAQH